MGTLPKGPFELRLAATLFLALLGIADLFGAWQVQNFSAFTPRGVAKTVAPTQTEQLAPLSPNDGERPVSLDEIDEERHRIPRELLVQDTHVHLPVYALTAAALSLVVLGLELGSRLRSILIAAAFAAPVLDFAGLWGAHLAPRAGVWFAALAIAGGLLMGLVYAVVFVSTLVQCWLSRPRQQSGTSQEKRHAS